MADQTALLEIRAQAEQALGEIQRLNAEFVAALGRMATAADKVSLDTATKEAAELGAQLSVAASKGTASLASLEAAGEKSTEQIAELSGEVKRAAANLGSASQVVAKFGSAAELAGAEAAAGLDKISRETDKAISDVGRLNREFLNAVGRMETAADQVEFDLAARSADELGRRLGQATTTAAAGLNRLQAEGRDVGESMQRLASESVRSAEGLNRAAVAADRFGKEASQATTKAGVGVEGLVKRLGGLLAAYVSLQQVGQLFRAIIANTEEARLASAQLAAGIEATGRSADFTVEALQAQASALQDVTNFSDEAIQRAQGLLLTFDKIGKETFPRATEVVLDLAVAMQTDARSAAIQLGKALQDPEKGLTALSRAGVQFTDAQKEQIKALLAANDTLGAHALILAEIESQTGGSARAARSASVGITALKEAAGDALEVIGEGGLVDELKRLTEQLNAFLKAAETTEGLKELGVLLGQAIGVAGLLASQLDNLAASGELVGSAFVRAAALVLQANASFASFIPGLGKLSENLQQAAVDLDNLGEKAQQRSLDILGKSADQLEEDLRNLGIEIRNLTPEQQAMVDLFNEAFDASLKASEGAKQLKDDTEELAGAEDDLADSAARVADELPRVADAATAAGAEIKSAAEDTRALIESFEELQRRASEGAGIAGIDPALISDAAAAVGELQAEIANLEAKPILSPDEVVRLAQLKDALPGLITNQQALAKSAVELGIAYEGAADAQQELIDRTTELNKLIESGASTEQIAEFLSGGKIGDGAQEAAEGVETLAFETKKLADGTTALVTPMERATTGIERLADGSIVLRDAADGLPKTFSEVGQGMEQAGDGAGSLADAVPGAATGLDDLADAATGSRDPLEQIGEVLERLAKNAPTMAAGIRELHAAVKSDVPGIVSGLGELADAYGSALVACQSFRACAGGGGS